MKKVLLFVCFLITTIVLNAQKLSVGGVWGVNGSFYDDNKPQAGEIGGLFISTRVSRHFDVQSYLLYSTHKFLLPIFTGACANCIRSDNKNDYYYLATSYEIPLLFALKTTQKKRVYSVNILAGPSIAYFHYTKESSGVSSLGDNRVTIKDINKQDRVILFNLGLELNIHLGDNWVAGSQFIAKTGFATIPINVLSAESLPNSINCTIKISRTIFK